jgi:integrase
MKVWTEPRRAALFTILATAGLRSGEVRALLWENAIEDCTALAVREAVKEHTHEIGSTKSGDQRVVLLPTGTAQLLKAWLKESPYTEPEALIFHGRKPEVPLGARTLNFWLADALGKVEINPGTRRLVVHSFRHTYNTMIKSVLPAETVRAMVGHKSDAMTNYEPPRVYRRH